MTSAPPPPPPWIDDFSIPADTAGAVVAVDFGDDGLWAARLDADGAVVRIAREPRITPAVLDLRVATYLHHSEAIPGTDDPQTFAELLDVCRRARASLIERESVLLMGTDRLRMVSVTLDTVLAATVPEANRANGVIVELAGSEPVAAVLLGPGIDRWPGLWEALTERGFAMLGPEDPFPELFAGDDAATHALQAISPDPVALAWATSAATPSADIAAPGTDAPDTGAPDTAAPGTSVRNPRRTRIALTAAALAVIALGGAGLATALSLDDTDQPSTAAESSTPSSTDPSVSGAPAAAPSELRAARAPMKRYVPPRTTSSTTSTTSEAPLGPRPRPKPRPDNRRTLPNPIPGLPPIVIG